jgi:hypothetical protein
MPPLPENLIDEIDWPRFMARHDLVWECLPRQWNEGAFLGNGLLGMMVYVEAEARRLVFHLGRSDVTDHRGAPRRKTSSGEPERDVCHDYPRLDLGRMTLHLNEPILEGTMRLDLWQAELRAHIRTAGGTLELRAYTTREAMRHCIEIEAADELIGDWVFEPGRAESPRVTIGFEPARNEPANPEPVFRRIGEVEICQQALHAGGDYATAWQAHKPAPGRHRCLISTANEIPLSDRSAEVAAAAVASCGTAELKAALAAHRAWWQAHYRTCFLSLPDPRLESFFWVQIYKIGAGLQADGPTLDLHGPWMRPNQWPGMWWNLNVQLTYWPIVRTSHVDLAHTLITEMDRDFDGILAHGWLQHAQGTLGDMAWALHNYWQHFRYFGDEADLRRRWLPKAAKVLKLYEEELEPDADGRLHLRPMGSPEYGIFELYTDTNYNLALLRWLLRTVDQCADPDEEAQRHRADLLERLVDPPVDADGLRIAADQAYERSHRHFSHLIGFYPLFVFDPARPAERTLLTRSIRHWLDLRNPDGSRDRCGFTLTVAAAMMACLGEGDNALGLLHEFLDNRILEEGTEFGSRLLPNTFYVESHGRNPTMETPLSAASALLEMLLQSRHGEAHIFPATPDGWQDAVFHRLSAEDGLRISAARKAGGTAWVALESRRGGCHRFRVADWLEMPRCEPELLDSLRPLGEGRFELRLPAGGSCLLRHPKIDNRPALSPLPRASEDNNPFGLRANQPLPPRIQEPAQSNADAHCSLP